MTPAPNSYSPAWFAFFQTPTSPERTTLEVNFICTVAPLAEFLRIVDVCCGMGRHSRALAARGYNITAIDRDSVAVEKARQTGGGVRYLEGDIRHYEPEARAYDAIIVMGQSFGHFDGATNQTILKKLSGGLRTGGRMLLDVWNPEFFVGHQGDRDLPTPRGKVRENKRVEGDRLLVRLTYPSGVEEAFEWQLFAPETIETMAHSTGLRMLAFCTDFDLSTKLDASKPRLQVVLEREP